MNDWFILIVGLTVGGGFVLLVLVGFSLLVLKSLGFFERKPTPEEVAESWRRHRERVIRPRWDELETRLGRPLSATLRALYADHELVQRRRFYLRPTGAEEDSDDQFVFKFLPADVETLDELDYWLGALRGDWLPFAQDDFGNLYLLNLSNDFLVRDAVYFLDHEDDGPLLLIADSLEQFLRWRIIDADEK